MLTILFGAFPIVLNVWTAAGITAYYASLLALGNYCRSWSHYKALWLANVSSAVFFYPYLRNSILTPIKQVRSAAVRGLGAALSCAESSNRAIEGAASKLDAGLQRLDCGAPVLDPAARMHKRCGLGTGERAGP